MINSFRSYLVEEEKTVYFTFGRMNPPTIGHEKLMNALSSKAGRNPYRIYVSQSTDVKKNPLDFTSKIKFARKMFPRHARQIMADKTMKNVMEIANKLYKEGFKRIVMVVGSDRTTEFETLLNKYNGSKGRHGFYNFERIGVMSAGERDPDAEGTTGMSASKMRAAASENDFTKFAQGLPKNVRNPDAKSLFNAVRKGMGLKETKEYKNHLKLNPVSERREDFIEGMFQPGDQVVIKESDVVATVIRRGANYLIVEANGVQMRKWLDAVEVLEAEGNQSSRQDPDIKDRKGTQPAPYFKGLKKSTKKARDAHFKKHGKKADNDPTAYKPAPGDKKAKTKPSKYTKQFKQMYGENDTFADRASKRIDREKQADRMRHDKMMDRARLRDTRKKNRETK